MRQFMDLVMTTTEYNYYLQSSLIDMDMENMSECLEIARQCQWGSLIANELLIGMKGTQIPLHYEDAETILIQMNGFAEIIIFDPVTSPNLYPFPYGHPCTNKQSMVNLEFMEKNASAFKKFSADNSAFDGTVYRGILEKGDVCYIPSLWWWELTNLNDFSSNLKVSSKPSKGGRGSERLNVAQVLNEKTMEQKIAIGRNLEKIVMGKYGPNGDMTHKIFESFLNEDEKYRKYRNDIRQCLRSVFNENEEIDAFLCGLVDGRYNIDCSQFVIRDA